MFVLLSFISIIALAQNREISKVFIPEIQPEGDGASVRRIIGSHKLRDLDPFLMLDHFNLKLPAGFPDHPHRGFETVTYLVKGEILHEDFKGNMGRLRPGDLQWMTAGKGIIHAEMPASFEEETEGFQLWINLPKSDKFCDPEYQEIKREEILVSHQDGVHVKVLAGEVQGIKSKITHRTPTFFLDVDIQPKATYRQSIPSNWNTIVYVYQGEISTGKLKTLIKQNSVVLFDKNEEDFIEIHSKEAPAKLLILSGEPLNEPVYQHGPFVLNSKDELQKTISDYRLEKNGFEGAHSWNSQIRNLNSKSGSADL